MRLTFDEGAALVAGGSGGIGSAVVRALAQCAIPVAFTYRRGREAAERLLAGHAGATRLAALAWDEPGLDAARALVERAQAEVGAIRFLVAATGRSQQAAFHTLSEEAIAELIEANLTGVLALARAVVTPMMKSGAGRIVLLGSVSGSRGIRGHSVYAATKAALEGFTRPLAREAGPFGVTVNCVAPGYIDTPMTASAPEPARRAWLKRIALGRLGRAEEVAALVAFLLSREAAYVTGQTYVIDGGVSL